MGALKSFLVNFVHRQRLETDPAKFLRAGYQVPCLYASCLSHLKSKKNITGLFTHVSRFIDYVLTHYYSVEDDHGFRIVPSEFKNPIPALPEAVDRHAGQNSESNKNVLPYHFISQLRSLLCPVGATSFADWKWAHAADIQNNRGSWFVVPVELIDKTDVNCVWRVRQPFAYERKKHGYGDAVHEMWSPVNAVALYVKLQLPLRTYQVRMLDSGEADSVWYTRGKWAKNTGPLAKGTESNPFRRGVFRQMTDGINHVSMTGLYINTNKTADLGKEEWSKGYTIPWQHLEVLYWLEKLRDWQSKYNPIAAPMPWTSLKVKHIGAAKAESTLKAMGSTCFLFRDAAGKGDDRFKPIVPNSAVEGLWYKLLQTLESQCASDNVFDFSGSPLVFVAPPLSDKSSTVTTYYPLHSLRVSLITAYALEGGVPMAILSKCIAGHARLIMTLYYTKAGITYCTETMNEATKRLMVNEQENYGRWLKDKTYEQVESRTAYNDPAAIRAVMQVMQNGASLVKDDKGFCPKGGWGCDSGGVYVNEEFGTVSYGEVPGYPQKNCPRCRWFLSGPAFIDGLNNHWNHIQLQMGDIGERVAKLEGQLISLEDQQFDCQEKDMHFLEQDQLNTLRKIYQAEVEKNNKHAEDSSATYRLIARCTTLAKGCQESEGIQLVAVGALRDVHIAIDECTKLQQVLNAVAGSTVYPEHDVSKAVLQAGKAYDLMLARNGKEPVFFKLSDEELPVIVAHMTRLLATEVGSIKGALPFIEGTRHLSELGLDLDLEALAFEMAASELVQSGSAARQRKSADGQRRMSSSAQVLLSEVSHDVK
jgi:Putative phage integrase